MPLLPQEGFRELHTQTPNSVVVRLLPRVAQDPGPNSLCLIQDDAGANTFLRKVVPACLGYLNIHGANEGRLSSTADDVHDRSDCRAPVSSAEPRTKWISPWGLAGFAGAGWSVKSPGRTECGILCLGWKRDLANLG